MSFLIDLECIIDNYFTSKGVPVPIPKPGLKRYAPMFFDFLYKSISVRPRFVKESDRVSTLLAAGFTRNADYQVIKSDFEAGRDLSKYLSKGSLKIQSDDMLWDWRIHHLHVETVVDSSDSRFVVRSNFQLFFFIEDETAYFLDIKPHLKGDQYSDIDFLDIIEDNWPELLGGFHLRSAVSLESSISQADRHQLRKVGINTMVQLKSGKVYMNPGLGFTAAKDPKISRRAVSKFDALRDGLIRMSQINETLPLERKLKLVLEDGELFFREAGTGNPKTFPGNMIFPIWL